MRWARRLSSRFAELEALRAGTKDRRRVTWLGERLALIRSSQGVVAVAVAPVWQIAAFAIGGLSLTALIVGMSVAGPFREAAERQSREIVALRDEVRAHTLQATRDRAVLDRLGKELSISTAERDRAASTVEADHRTAAEREALIAQAMAERSRLAFERDVAVEQVASTVERANADRRRLEQERDHAKAERDDLAGEVDSALHELDSDTRRTVAEVEKIIGAFGVDPRLVRQPLRDRVDARGGPYIPWRGPVTASGSGAGRFESVAQRLERLKGLRDTLQQLPVVMPVTHAVISGGFGFRFDPFNGVSARHEGVDLRAAGDQTVHASGAGTVISAGWNGEFGNMIEIDHGFAVVTRYAHLSRINVHRGDIVMPGQPLGVIGATGRATGAHLHYEIRIAGQARDPLKLLSAIQASRDSQKESAGDNEPFAGFHQP
jgi:murein DD-endopeptidase MepM/ murein hydrolase activator NlpD